MNAEEKAKWLSERIADADARGSRYLADGNGTLAETTGLECWRNYYDDAYSPREAFNEDQTYWD